MSSMDLRIKCFAYSEDCCGDLEKLNNCNKDTADYLRRISQSRECITEAQLILARYGLFDFDRHINASVCATHRAILGIKFRDRSTTCSHPMHTGARKAQTDRTISLQVSKEIKEAWKVVTPVGSAVCQSCRQSHLEAYKHMMEENAAVVSVSSQSATSGSQHSQIFSQESNSSANLKTNHDTPTLQTKWEAASYSTKFRYRTILLEEIKHMLEKVTPGNEDAVWEDLQKYSLDGKEIRSDKNATASLEEQLIAAYNEAGTPTLQKQLLSLLAYRHSKDELMTKIPGITVSKIDQARKHAEKYGPGSDPNEAKGQDIRESMDMLKVEHFVEFMLSPSFTQDIAFGTKTLKFDNGYQVAIPNVVRTVILTRIIQLYQDYCNENNYKALSRSSLYKCRNVCLASQRKALQGLDEISAEGLDSIDKLINMCNKIKDETGADTTTTRQKLLQAKQYLKSEYRLHVKESDQCGDHCIMHGLSDSSEPSMSNRCDHSHNRHCVNCDNIREALKDTTDLIKFSEISADLKDEMLHDADVASKNVLYYKAHLLKAVNQERCKQDITETLCENEVLIVRDFAMKFCPRKYRETMADWFGKQGLSWHIDVAIFRRNDQLDTLTLIHVIESGKQNWAAVVTTLTHTLQKLKSLYPHLTGACIRSDNAGCYKSSCTLFAVRDHNKCRNAVYVKRIDFSEPQSGKDICDRHCSGVKLHMINYVHAGHNILTAYDMKSAIESLGGVKGTMCAVVSIPEMPDKDNNSKPTWKGITTLNNFEFSRAGIRVWQAYGVGDGRLYSNKELKSMSAGFEFKHEVVVLEEFTNLTKTHGKMSVAKQHKEGGVTLESTTIFRCDECLSTFKSEEELQSHASDAVHKMTSMDKTRQLWALKCSEIKAKQHSLGSDDVTTGEDDNRTQCGWALKKTRSSRPFPKHVKDYVHELFDLGVKTGRKLSPEQAALKMRKATGEDGSKRFSVKECLSGKQFQSQFSMMARATASTSKHSEASSEPVDEGGVEAMTIVFQIETET